MAVGRANLSSSSLQLQQQRKAAAASHSGTSPPVRVPRRQADSDQRSESFPPKNKSRGDPPSPPPNPPPSPSMLIDLDDDFTL